MLAMLQRAPRGRAPLTSLRGTNVSRSPVNPLWTRLALSSSVQRRPAGVSQVGATSAVPFLQRKCGCSESSTEPCAECEAKSESPIARAATADAGATAVPPLVGDVVASSGEALDEGVRQWAEPRIGHDLRGVRVHTDARAAESARSIDALAYTVNRHVVFGERQYQPSTRTGRKLIAHELAHVAQQSSGVSPSAASGIGPANHPTEVEAERTAEAAVSNAAPVPVCFDSRPAGVVARQPTPPSAVNCGSGAHGAPADPDTVLDMTKTIAILATVVADADLSLLQLDAILPGFGAGGGFTMPAGNRMNN